jgi:hypothetical protein
MAMIQITFTPETPQQVAALTQAMMAYIGTPAEAPAPAPEPVAKKRKPEAPAAETPAPVTTWAATLVPPPAVTLEQVRAKLTELSQGGKAADVKSLIAKFGGTKLTDLKAEQYADVLAAAEALEARKL